MNNINLPIHQDTEDARNTRLRSRKPPIKTARMIHEEFNITNAWCQEWNAWQNNMPCITHKPPGFDLPRKTWSTLNRIQTRHGRCVHMLHKWGKNPSPQCDCGENQTIDHIIEECPSRSYNGSPEDFLFATSESIDYINTLDVCL
ncbi:uncharacterized protein LOC126883395 [Diabrotica virgifera virgifera]|uniref:Uncharacterized protein n=1 Tax=Diabrotica virgifera virgifera TaxID=50390 RepID=A0ABM5K3X5_DIAVI|nr:uncharacterized protein LOC126883395 [Diabrotica virgifera virgifera]